MFVLGQYPVYCGTFSNIYGYKALNASSMHIDLVVTTKSISRHYQMSPGMKNST